MNQSTQQQKQNGGNQQQQPSLRDEMRKEIDGLKADIEELQKSHKALLEVVDGLRKQQESMARTGNVQSNARPERLPSDVLAPPIKHFQNVGPIPVDKNGKPLDPELAKRMAAGTETYRTPDGKIHPIAIQP